jgi:hypothetical protein
VLKDLFDFNALKSKEKEIVLLTIRGYSLLGTPLPEAFRLLSRIEKNKKFLKVYKMINYQIHDKGVEPSEAMVKMKIINTFEAFILKNSTSTKKAIDDIIDIRKNGSKYEKKLFSMFMGAAIWFFSTLLSLPYLSAKIQLAEEAIIKSLKLGQGIDITGQIEFPFWVANPLMNILIYTIFTGFILGVLTYIYYHKTYPYKLYSVFKGKAYSDISIFLNIINVLKTTGKDTKLVVDILIKSNQFKRELPLLKALANSKTISEVFARFSYPEDIVYFTSMGEKNKMLWTSMGELVNFSKNAGTVSLEKMEFYYKRPLLFMSIGFAIFVGLDVMMLAFNAVNLFLNTTGM